MPGQGKDTGERRWWPLSVLGAGIGTVLGATLEFARRRHRQRQQESSHSTEPSRPSSPKIEGYRTYRAGSIAEDPDTQN